MEKLRTSLTIIRHSLRVMLQHPLLLVFPVISLAAAVVVYVFFLAPLLFDTTLGEIWYRLRLPDESWDTIAPWRAGETAGNLWQRHFAAYAAYYLLAMFTMTFFNVALYSQIIEAMNGGRVSVMRGLAVAGSKVRAIIAWSLMAGVVGVILRALQERLGFPGKWVAAFAGLSWSAASVFVIPVIIREPQSRSPLDYLRISTGLVRRVWGEGVAGIGSVALLFVLMFVVFVVLSVAAQSISGSYMVQVATLSSLTGVLIFGVLYLGWQIFECGLYVYATEGVAPGTFDDKVFDRVWVLKDGAASVDPTKPARRVPWSKIWRIVPLAVAGVSIWMHFFSPWDFTKLPEPRPSFVSSMRIDLDELGYRLGIDDLRAAGLFLDEKEPGKKFFAKGSEDKYFAGKDDAGLRPDLYKARKELWVNFYGDDKDAGKQRVRRAVQLLQSRFPGHENAIAVIEDSGSYTPRTTVISWPALRGATSYGLEIDCFECCGNIQWCTDIGSEWKIVTDLKSTTYTFDWEGAQPGRVRVWGINADGRRGLKSPWTDFDYNW